VAKDLRAAALGTDSAEVSIAIRMALSLEGLRLPAAVTPRHRRKENKVAVITPATFVLMIIIGTSPPQQRGEFQSYHHCYEAAQGEVAHLGPNVRWDCVAKSPDGEEK
jgi:hypothetical protein